tara:strand:- start:738 stop:893 length:156 start_codon:yes stop_codon:yes gene_type:complete
MGREAEAVTIFVGLRKPTPSAALRRLIQMSRDRVISLLAMPTSLARCEIVS